MKKLFITFLSLISLASTSHAMDLDELQADVRDRVATQHNIRRLAARDIGDNYFYKIKEYLELHKNRMPNFCFYSQNDKTKYSHCGPEKEDSDCDATAKYVINLLTGENDLDAYDYIDINKLTEICRLRYGSNGYPLSVILSNKTSRFINRNQKVIEYTDTLENFLKRSGSGTNFNQKIARKLFSTTEQPEHLLFYVVLTGLHDVTYHAYVIEKINNGNKSWYRIYQSWYNKFTLSQWLGINKWDSDTNNDDYYNNHHHAEESTKIYHNACEEFGNGKQLNVNEILRFIQLKPLHRWRLLEDDCKFNIRMFNIGQKN